MRPHFTALSLALLTLTTPILSQTTNTNQITWAAVTYTYHGEKTPDFHTSARTVDLTPLGAEQVGAFPLISSSIIEEHSLRRDSEYWNDSEPISSYIL
jgi:hypothetical protein